MICKQKLKAVFIPLTLLFYQLQLEVQEFFRPRPYCRSCSSLCLPVCLSVPYQLSTQKQKGLGNQTWYESFPEKESLTSVAVFSSKC